MFSGAEVTDVPISTSYETGYRMSKTSQKWRVSRVFATAAAVVYVRESLRVVVNRVQKLNAKIFIRP